MSHSSRIGTFSALSIGIGGMVGGGIFAVTGLTVELTRGAAPVAFVVAGIVALLTAWSYWKLSLRYPSEGGTVEFINVAFGPGVLTGALNILLCFAYVILLAVYAYAFGAYAASLLPAAAYDFWLHTFLSAVIVGLAVLNWFGADLAIRSGNAFNATKMILLAVFVAVGLATPMDWSRLAPAEWVSPLPLVAGAMIIFLNYEGFELIANASDNLKNPKRALPIAYLGGVVFVIGVYILVSMVVVGHLKFSAIAAEADYSLSVAAHSFMGMGGHVMIVVAALLATSSAINATFYGSGRLTYLIAKSGELPGELERDFHGQPLEGMILFAVLALLVANFIPLAAIATMGSAGFLLVFLAVNLAHFRMRRETKSAGWLALVAVAACAIALVTLVGQTLATPDRAWHVWILAGMIVAALAVEMIYRALTGRSVVLRHLRHKRERPTPPSDA